MKNKISNVLTLVGTSAVGVSAYQISPWALGVLGGFVMLAAASALGRSE